MVRGRGVIINVTAQTDGIDKPGGMTYGNTTRFIMPKAKIAISLDERILEQLDQLVRSKAFASRSRAIEEAVEEKLGRLSRVRLARECAKLDPVEEKRLSEEGLVEEISGWPEY